MQTQPQDSGAGPGAGPPCPNCTAANPAGADFCWRCYAPFQPGQAWAGPALQPVPPAPAGPRAVPPQAPGGPYAGPWDTPPASPKRRTLNLKSVIGLIPLVLILVGVNAWRGNFGGQTHFEYPEQLAGLTRMHDAAAREYEGRVAVVDGADGDEFETVGAAYGEGATVGLYVGTTEGQASDTTDELFSAVAWVVQGADPSPELAVRSGDRDGTEYRCGALGPSTTLCMWREDDNHGFVVMPGKSVDVTLDTMFRVRGQLEA